MPTATADPAALHLVFETLKPILADHAGGMIVVQDGPGTYNLNTNAIAANGQPLAFGGVEIKKNYVSFHVFPVYMYPDLLEGIGDLRKRMQGKSCFNFRKIDDAHVAALRALVRAGHERLRREGLLT